METRDFLLAGVWAKIERAEKHVNEFDNNQRAFLESYPVAFTHKRDQSTGHYKVIIENIRPVPPELSLSIGDAIHNLRSALDLLACQLVRLENPAHDCDHISFPILNSSEDYKMVLNKDKKIQLMGQPGITILKQLQLYKDGKLHDLWVLHRLDIQDKHRLLLVTLPSISHWSGNIVFIPSAPGSGVNRVFDVGASVSTGDFYVPKAGDEISGIDPDVFSGGEEGELRVHFQFNGHLALNEPGIIQSMSAVNTIQSFVSVVKDTVQHFLPLFSN